MAKKGDNQDRRHAVVKEGFETLFSTNRDNFARNRNVESHLVHGDTDYVSNPLITIAIPTYRRAALLRLAIDSVLCQVNVDCEYEIVVVDNDPAERTDTERLIRSYDIKNLLYYRNEENLGMFGNWNRCIELARGKWIAFLHDDDMLTETYISRVLPLLERKRDIGAVMSAFIPIRNSGPHHVQTKEPRLGLRKLIHGIEGKRLTRLFPTDSQIMNGNIYGAPTCGNIFRREYLLDLGGFDQDYYPSSDWFFLLKFSARYKVYKTRSQFGYYRLMENESLNPETTRMFIVHAEDLRVYLASTTRVGKILHTIFADERYFHTLRWIRNMGDSGVDFETLTRGYGYRDRPTRSLVYDRIVAFYRHVKRIATLIIG